MESSNTETNKPSDSVPTSEVQTGTQNQSENEQNKLRESDKSVSDKQSTK